MPLALAIAATFTIILAAGCYTGDNVRFDVRNKTESNVELYVVIEEFEAPIKHISDISWDQMKFDLEAGSRDAFDIVGLRGPYTGTRSDRVYFRAVFGDHSPDIFAEFDIAKLAENAFEVTVHTENIEPDISLR